MKISVSLPEEDVHFLDRQGPNRSAALQRAVSLLRDSQLADQYAEAYAEWDNSDDARLWDAVTTDGLPA
jgi:Arc/MetJ-type ribon-helix-helix transcriptional regulator